MLNVIRMFFEAEHVVYSWQIYIIVKDIVRKQAGAHFLSITNCQHA